MHPVGLEPMTSPSILLQREEVQFKLKLIGPCRLNGTNLHNTDEYQKFNSEDNFMRTTYDLNPMQQSIIKQITRTASSNSKPKTWATSLRFWSKT